MPRIRSIKPGFFLNEELAGMPCETRLLFIGLWTLADKEGRLEDRPRKIKAEIFPYEDRDVDAMLTSLADGGFIQRYEGKNSFGEQVRCIQVVKFSKHQSPHPKEAINDLSPPVKSAEKFRGSKPRNTPAPDPACIVSYPSVPSGMGNGHGDGVLNTPAAEPQVDQTEPPSKALAIREPDHYYEIFAEAYRECYEGVPYTSQRADFVQLAAAKKKLAGVLDLAGWQLAVGNYLATPQRKHTLADLACNYATFHKHALNEFTKPAGVNSAALAVREGQTVDRKTAEMLDQRGRFLDRHGVRK